MRCRERSCDSTIAPSLTSVARGLLRPNPGATSTAVAKCLGEETFPCPAFASNLSDPTSAVSLRSSRCTR